MTKTEELSRESALQIANIILIGFKHICNTVEMVPNHIYKLSWYNRLFFVTFYNSPEVYGYSSALPDSETHPYIFCSIVEMYNRLHKKYEMNFGFNPETKEFLELFDLEHHIKDDFVKECRDTNSVERQLRGKILY